MEWIIYGLLCVVTFFLWNVIHECSHVLAAKKTAGLHKVKIIPWPHKHEGRFYFARTTWQTVTTPTHADYLYIYLAPRLPDILACIGLLLVSNIYISIFLAGGLVDLFIGSLGISKISDLRIASWLTNANPWLLRVFGMAIVVVVTTIKIISII